MIRPILQSIKKSPIGNLLRQRHLFCVGLPKAGTESIARLFDRSFRSVHEPRYVESIELACAFEAGQLSTHEVTDALIARDREMRLDMEASHVMARFAPSLADTFKDARFILTIREPISWLDSEINQCINYPNSNTASGFAPWIRLRNVCYGPIPADRPSEELALETYQLHSLDGMLGYWQRHISGVLKGVPRDRLLVLRVEDLSNSLEQIAKFADVPGSSLAAERSHSHKAAVRHRVLSGIPADYLRSKVAQHCSALCDVYYPDSEPARTK